MFIYTLESRIIVGVGIIGWGGNKDVLGGKNRKIIIISQYMCGHNLTMKFPPDFHNYTGLKGLVNSYF